MSLYARKLSSGVNPNTKLEILDDGTMQMVDKTDPTKKMNFDLSNIPTGSTINFDVIEDSANLPAQATAWTLTAASPEFVYIGSPTGAVNQSLPTTNVVKGKIFTLVVTGATETNYVKLQSSGAEEIARIGGAGIVRVQALQNTPTTAAHWKVLDLYESMSVTASVTGPWTGSKSIAAKLVRSNVVASIITEEAIDTFSADADVVFPAATLPARFRPTADLYAPVAGFVNNGALVIAGGAALIGADGSITAKKPAAYTAGNCGLSRSSLSYSIL